MSSGTIKTGTVTLTSEDVVFSDFNSSEIGNLAFQRGTVFGNVFSLGFTCNIKSSSTTWISSIYIHNALLTITILGRALESGTGGVTTGNGILSANVTSDFKLRIRYFSKSSSAEDITIRLVGTLV